ncbi:6-bladed beta-propeller [bacterium]|nr:6-bladed beta-propeller [bacterium]
MKICLFGIVFLLQFLSNLSVNAQIKKIDIIKKYVIGGLEAETIYQWVDVVVDNKKNIYITDMMDYSVKKFDSKGNLLKKTGRKGQGPGEFIQIRGIEFRNDSLFVLDERNLGIQIFDDNLNYIGRISCNNIIQKFQVDAFCFILKQFSFQSTASLVRVNNKGIVLSEVNYDPGQMNPLLGSIDFTVSNSGNVYIAFLFQDKLIKMAPSGEKLWERNLFNKAKTKMSTLDKLQFQIPEDTFFKAIALDTLGNVFILGGKKSKHKSRDVYVFSDHGDFLCEFTLQESSHLIYIDSENNLYSREDQGVSLAKYEIIYN